MSLNVVHLVGRAGKDPDIKYFEDSGSVLCTLTLAVNRNKKDDEPDWFNLEIWGKTGENAYNYVRKGRLIGVKGVLKIDTWIDKNTNANRSKPIIKVDKWEFLDSKRDADPSQISNYDNNDF